MELEQLSNLVIQLEQKLNTMEIKLAKQDKTIKKLKKEVMPESEKKTRKPSGFAKPTYISPALCKFLEVPEGTEVARTEVTKRITEYVKVNGLQNSEHRKNIDMDEKLTELLNPNEPVTYFNIQKMLKVHYKKPESETSDVVENSPCKLEKITKKSKAQKV